MDADTSRLLALLAPLTNFERDRPDPGAWSLDTMRALLAQPDFALPKCPLVQVGGSKGKGTTTLYLESLAKAAGWRPGSYLSPHQQSPLERIRIDARNATAAAVATAVESMLAYARDRGLGVTFFEVMTRAALDCFARERVRFGALEVGLGGRLDATTAVPVDASIVTTIELEHTELLGDTIEAIAGEKAWVLRPGRPGFTSTSGVALDVLRAHATRTGNELHVLGLDFALEDVAARGDTWTGVLRLANQQRRPFRLRAAAAVELDAFALAAACLHRLCPELPLALDPVPRPYLPGRCEVIDTDAGGVLVLDGAHTERSLQALAAELARRFPGQRLSVLFASLRGKRWRDGLGPLVAMTDRFVVTALDDARSEDPEAIAAWLRQQGAVVEIVPSVAHGMQRLAQTTAVRVVTGSFYLVGAARGWLEAGGR